MACGTGPSLDFPYGFFDGAVANYKGGVSFCLVLNESHSFEFAMGAGICTNPKAELMALWALLSVAKMMGIPCLNIFGDSTVIINWANFHASLDPPNLSHWCMDTRRLISSFIHLSFTHTYREHNQLANKLSKYAQSLAPGCGNYSKFLEGHLVLSDTFHLF